MKILKKYLIDIIAVGIIFSCTACSGLDSFADNLKSGAEQLNNDVAIGKSNALITPYQSFSDAVHWLYRRCLLRSCDLVQIDPDFYERVVVFPQA